MSRQRHHTLSQVVNVPRASGDEPDLELYEVSIVTCAPRQRG